MVDVFVFQVIESSSNKRTEKVNSQNLCIGKLRFLTWRSMGLGGHRCCHVGGEVGCAGGDLSFLVAASCETSVAWHAELLHLAGWDHRHEQQCSGDQSPSQPLHWQRECWVFLRSGEVFSAFFTPMFA